MDGGDWGWRWLMVIEVGGDWGWLVVVVGDG